jgi:hypothetical protein
VVNWPLKDAGDETKKRALPAFPWVAADVGSSARR